MRISKQVFQSSQQNVSNVREYSEHSIVIRESIFSLSARLFFVEFVLGVLGLGVRLPILYLTDAMDSQFFSLGLYAAVYILYQVVNVGILLYMILDWYNRSYVIRDQDMVLRHGIVNVDERLLQYDNVEKILVRQGILGRIFNFGTVELYNPLLKENMFFRNVPDPKLYAEMIQGTVPKMAPPQTMVVNSR